jgi:hypothetical protein
MWEWGELEWTSLFYLQLTNIIQKVSKYPILQLTNITILFYKHHNLRILLTNLGYIVRGMLLILLGNSMKHCCILIIYVVSKQLYFLW